MDVELRLREVLAALKDDDPRARPARHALNLLEAGIVPPARTLRLALRAQADVQPATCGHLGERDGTCAWLRQYGAGYPELKDAVPPVGERPICPFNRPANRSGLRHYDWCPGYTRADK